MVFIPMAFVFPEFVIDLYDGFIEEIMEIVVRSELHSSSRHIDQCSPERDGFALVTSSRDDVVVSSGERNRFVLLVD